MTPNKETGHTQKELHKSLQVPVWEENFLQGDGGKQTPGGTEGEWYGAQGAGVRGFREGLCYEL